MAQPQTIPIADLLADMANPRLSQTSEGQRETLRALAAEQGTKLTVLARDIVEYGLNPGDPFYVIQLEDGSQRFVVVEGNRRLAALRALENADLFDGAVKPGTLTTLRRLGKKYQVAPIERVNCTLFNSREESRHWVQLRHTGEAQVQELSGGGVTPRPDLRQARMKGQRRLRPWTSWSDAGTSRPSNAVVFPPLL